MFSHEERLKAIQLFLKYITFPSFPFKSKYEKIGQKKTRESILLSKPCPIVIVVCSFHLTVHFVRIYRLLKVVIA